MMAVPDVGGLLYPMDSLRAEMITQLRELQLQELR